MLSQLQRIIVDHFCRVLSFEKKAAVSITKECTSSHNNCGRLLQSHNLWYIIIIYLSLIVVLQPLDKDVMFGVFFAEFALK